ncbi:putative manganese transporter [Egicoccus sp. AB-alg2]|uniref:putative manganese transporter n=1 Tax=Egicoccus sp. AB-alg2 TaxID=3242693 RepID=UPI00359DA7BF
MTWEGEITGLVEVVLRPAAEAFLGVTVFVATMMGVFAVLHWRLGPALPRLLARHRRYGPLLGALLGVVPGCGGAIFVIPLYARRQVSFGTVVAALVATMGDSSFVLFAADPGLALRLHGLLFVTGLVVGIVVDACRYAPAARPAPVAVVAAAAGSRSLTSHADEFESPAAVLSGRDMGGEPAFGNDARWKAAVFWLLVLLGLSVSVPDLVGGADPLAPTGPRGAAAAVGLTGTAMALWLARERRCGGAPEASSSGGLHEVLAATAVESARVGMWIAFVLVGVEVVGLLGAPIVLIATLSGMLGVAAGALLGLVPGCAPQIVLTGMYAGGLLPFPTLVANALSQDGDALLPLLLLDPRAAIVANLVTTVPGLIVGGAVLVLAIAP